MYLFQLEGGGDVKGGTVEAKILCVIRPATKIDGWDLAQWLERLIVNATKYLYIKSTTVYVPSSALGLSQPLSRHRVCPSPQNRGGGGTLACGKWVGGVQIRWLVKGLALCLLCGQCRSRNCPGFDPSILRHSGIWGAADETVLNTVHKNPRNGWTNTQQ